VDQADGKGSEDAQIRERLENLYEFFKTLDIWRRQMLDMSPREIKRAAKIGSKVRRLLRTGS
jgi:hypothetical protein